MDVATLVSAMPGLGASKAEEVLPHLHAAMARGEITTLRRAQYFLAQLGHESLSLKYFAEIASGAAYEGRGDLGNTHQGDGRRFKGRGPIQLTGRTNYTNFGKWLGKSGLFVRRPELVERYDYGFLAAVFYWSTPHGRRGAPLNVYCDAGDFEGLTRAINGGLNGYNDRCDRLRRIEQLGDAILPSPADPYAVLTRAERSAVRRLNALRAVANRPREEGGGWGSLADPRSRKSRAKRVKALIRRVLMRRIRATATATGWGKGHRRERYQLLKAAAGEASPARPDSEPDGAPPAPPDAEPDSPPPYPGQPLTQGSTGEAVRTWQAQMHKRGWTIDVDSAYGPASERVCRDFQEQEKLEVDGEVGPKTWEATWAAPVTEPKRPPKGSIAGEHP